MQALVASVREVRHRYTIDPKKGLSVFVRCNLAIAQDFAALKPFITSLAGASSLTCGPDVAKPRQPGSFLHPDFAAYVSLEGLIDVPTEVKRSEKQLAEKRKHLAATEAKLANEGFVSRAAPEVVQQQRELAADLRKQIETLEENLRELQSP
jgi:valyl-tRNA synthetase